MSADQFPPRVPCPGLCEYGACSDPGQHFPAPYGCGGCCRCLGGCHLEWDVEQAMIPETRDQAWSRKRWEALQAENPEGGWPL